MTIYNKITYLLLSLGLFLTFPSATFAQKSNTPSTHLNGMTIRGQVVDEYGEPLIGATIRLVSMKPKHKLLGETVTGANGCFRIKGSGEKLFITAKYLDRKSTRLNSSHANISYAVFCLK